MKTAQHGEEMQVWLTEMSYQKAVSVWKLMVSRTCSGALSSNSSMMKMRW